MVIEADEVYMLLISEMLLLLLRLNRSLDEGCMFPGRIS